MITRRKELTAGIAALSLMLALSVAPACKTVGQPPVAQTQTQQEARLQEMNHLADLAEKAIDVARAAQDTEIQVYESKLVPNLDAAAHEQVQTAFKKFFDEAQKELSIAKDVSTTDANRRTAVDRISDRIDELVAAIKIENPLVKSTISALLAAGRFLNASVV